VQYLIKTIAADRFTPLLVFKKLQAKGLLESAILEMGKSRYSIILVEEAFRIQASAHGIERVSPQATTILSKNPGDFLSIIEACNQERQMNEYFDFPIPSGGCGYIGYEMVQYFDEINLTDQKDIYHIPQALMSYGSVYIIFDHYRDTLNIVVIDQQNPDQKANEIIARINQPDTAPYQDVEAEVTGAADLYQDKSLYLAGVEKIKEHICRGNLLQAVLGRTIAATANITPLEAYTRLRRDNPSPYLFYFDFNDFQLFGASPEVMVKVTNRTAVIKPLAGTRPRGKTTAEDLALETELLKNEKELAEHIMLIDLARNDLGRIAEPGSVKPIRTFFVERYSHVMHIVSEVEAKVRQDKTIADVIRASFPAGTLSGAPKIKAIEILSELEPQQRGPYGGLVGYFDAQGNFDSCITIRSVLYKQKTFYISSGAGIVYDSDPEKEFTETLNKAGAMLRSIGVSL
jgi:anthranilate synthase component 1